MNDWIEWNGGDCPVKDGMLVDVKLRNGLVFNEQVAWSFDCKDISIDPNCESKGGGSFWRNHDSDADIIAYRVNE